MTSLNPKTNSGECKVAVENIPPLVKEFAGAWIDYQTEVGCISKYIYIGGDCTATVDHLNAIMEMRCFFFLLGVWHI